MEFSLEDGQLGDLDTEHSAPCSSAIETDGQILPKV
jgi:hypothetical protein